MFAPTALWTGTMCGNWQDNGSIAALNRTGAVDAILIKAAELILLIFRE
jgi:hypothetical protein